ncbi:class I SAM-dependent methyltransferase [Streptomyces fragilis]|uniref:Class I SAM-dependent methyltransferase n=1 Tax=Streptomyces fragilis TaxID=67301 RepID=A0ABV2YEU2_9ACTN|nr:class I SAM-dependent methyltransferase [Streptomyces fragilis]
MESIRVDRSGAAPSRPSEPERRNLAVWSDYGDNHLSRGTEIPEPGSLYWGYWEGVGPGEEILGDLTGCRVLDLCSGMGRFAAYLARGGVRVDAVEGARSQHERAVARFGGPPGLRFVHADAVTHLGEAEPYDVVLCAHGLAFLDPYRVLPALASALTPGGRLVFSVLHTNSEGDGPRDTVTARRETLRLVDVGPRPVEMWVLTPSRWRQLLVEHGLTVGQVEVLTAPGTGDPTSCTLLCARRPD